MDGDGVGVGELVEFVKPVIHALVFIGEDGELAVLQGYPGYHGDGAVEDPGAALVLVVAQLGDLVPDPEYPAAVTPFGLPLPGRGELFLQQRIQVARTGRSPVHGGERLHIPAGIKAETARDPPRDDIDRQNGRFLAVVRQPCR